MTTIFEIHCQTLELQVLMEPLDAVVAFTNQYNVEKFPEDTLYNPVNMFPAKTKAH